MKHIILTLCVVLMAASCNNDDANVDNSSASQNQLSAKIETKSNDLENSIYQVFDAYFETNPQNRFGAFSLDKDLSDCAEISFVEIDNGRLYTVDFGDACEDDFGNVHSGTAQVRRTVVNEQVNMLITFITYAFNSNTFVGTIDSQKFMQNNQLHVNRTSNLTINYTTEGVSNQRSAQHNSIKTQGNATPLVWQDDVYSVLGNAQNVLSNGNTWTSENSTAVIRPGTCNFFAVSGVKTIVRNGDQNLSLDYGDGSCDGMATLTLPNGDTVNVTQF